MVHLPLNAAWFLHPFTLHMAMFLRRGSGRVLGGGVGAVPALGGVSSALTGALDGAGALAATGTVAGAVAGSVATLTRCLFFTNIAASK